MLNSPIEKSLEKIYPDCFISQTSSGTSALVSILLALKKHKSNKNEVVIPSVVCPAVLHAVNFVGLKPVFVDMETTFFNMDLNSIKSKIGKRTLSIICVHCYGLAADIFKIKKILKKNKIFLIEDACLSFGGKLNNKYFGSFGDASIISFGYDKILSEAGGALIIKNKKIYFKVKKIINDNPVLGEVNLNKKRFLKKIDALEENIYIRKINAKIFYSNLPSNILIKPKFRNEDVYWRYPVICKLNREKMIERAKKKKINHNNSLPIAE